MVDIWESKIKNSSSGFEEKSSFAHDLFIVGRNLGYGNRYIYGPFRSSTFRGKVIYFSCLRTQIIGHGFSLLFWE